MSDLPPGYAFVDVRTTHLEMLRNEVPVAPDVPAPWQIERWVKPPLDEYRDLFRAVGGEWGWTGSLIMADAEMTALLNDDRTEIWRLIARPGSGPAASAQVVGFIELDRTIPGETEIVYFGLAREFIGRGLGGVLLRWAIHHVWTTTPAAPDAAPTKRLWLHTCDFDHPGALAVYQKAGFAIFEEHVGPEAYPEAHIARLGTWPSR
jgi:ribosomal protein S18 acetylase RimI-like enzyme